MKGQYLTVEWVFFFAIGVTLVILVFAMFSTMGLSYRDAVAELQLERSGELIRSGVVRAFETSKNGGTVELNISIPTQLSRCIYMIESDIQLRLTCIDNTEIKTVLNLYGINTKSENIIYSTNGVVTIRGVDGVVDLS